jgi:hypothetical protein
MKKALRVFIAFALLSLSAGAAGTSFKPSDILNSGGPVPLCSPDNPNCDGGVSPN